jgi:hypothetical protein
MAQKIFTQIITGADIADLKTNIDGWASYGQVIKSRQTNSAGTACLIFYYAPYAPDDSLRFGNGKFVITWDGDVASCIYGLSVLLGLGEKATLYVTTDNVDGAGYFTWANVIQANADGFNLGCHGKTHTSFTSLSDVALAAELAAVDAAFIAHGLAAPTMCAYPSGDINAAKKLVVAVYRLSGRMWCGDASSFGVTHPLQYKDVDKYETNAFNMASGTPGVLFDMVTFKEKMLLAQQNKTFMIGINHGCTDIGAYATTKTSDLLEIVAYAHTIGMDIIDYSQLFALLP